jgi:carbon monoxide dehydrogenase subunit G
MSNNMAKIIKTVSVNVAPSKIMGYVSDVKNHTAFIPPLKSVENVDGNERTPGASWEWTFDMGGVELKGKAETLEYKEGELFRYKTQGGIESTFTYRVSPEGQGTKLSIEVDYEVPQSVLGKIADKSIVEKMNTAQADAAANNIKSILEG